MTEKCVNKIKAIMQVAQILRQGEDKIAIDEKKIQAFIEQKCKKKGCDEKQKAANIFNYLKLVGAKLAEDIPKEFETAYYLRNECPVITDLGIQQAPGDIRGQYGVMFIKEGTNGSVSSVTKYLPIKECDQFLNELKTYRKFIGTYAVPQLYASYACSQGFFLKMQKMQGDFFAYVLRYIATKTDEHEKFNRMMCQFIYLILVMQKLNIVYTDAKPDNIMYDGDDLYIIDLGKIGKRKKMNKFSLFGNDRPRYEAAVYWNVYIFDICLDLYNEKLGKFERVNHDYDLVKLKFSKFDVPAELFRSADEFRKDSLAILNAALVSRRMHEIDDFIANFVETVYKPFHNKYLNPNRQAAFKKLYGDSKDYQVYRY